MELHVAPSWPNDLRGFDNEKVDSKSRGCPNCDVDAVGEKLSAGAFGRALNVEAIPSLL
jgi:hypothetical protein